MIDTLPPTPVARRVNLHEGTDLPPSWMLIEHDKFGGNGFTVEALYSGGQLAAAVAMERERWTEAVMQELDSNGHAKAIVAAATACDHRWMVTQQGMTYHDCRCEKCGATKRESWD